MERREPSGLSPNETFGTMLRRLRERRGLTQSALARAVGLSSSTVNMLEAGVRHSSRESALALAVALELDPVETDGLLLAGVHLPTSYFRLGPADQALLQAITTLLTDTTVPETRRDRFSRLVGLALDLCRVSDD
jgi:transcriptional regulator with XRE-family HTH domain